MYQWHWDLIWHYRQALLEAAWVTLWLNVLIIIIGSLTGVIFAALSLSSSVVARWVARVYNDIFRTLPVLVMLVWFFFCVPVITGLQLNPVTCAVIVLSLNLSAFMSEIVRAGIESIPKHQSEAARIMGFSDRQIFTYITLPVALRNMVPPIVGQYINTIKLSVLASVISVPELLFRTTDLISQTYRPLEFYTALAVIYLVLLLPLTMWSRRLENKQFVKSKSSLA